MAKDFKLSTIINLSEEYDRAPSPPSSLKIRAFLSPPKPTRKSISSPHILHNSSSKTTSSSSSSSSSTSPSSSLSPIGSTPRFSASVADVCHHQILPPAVPFQRSTAKIKPHSAYHAYGKPSHSFLIHNRND